MTEPPIVFYLRLENGSLVSFECSKNRKTALTMELPDLKGNAGVVLRFLRAAYTVNRCACGSCLMRCTDLSREDSIAAMAELRESGHVVLITEEDIH